jgi:hypothetical protein
MLSKYGQITESNAFEMSSLMKMAGIFFCIGF